MKIVLVLMAFIFISSCDRVYEGMLEKNERTFKFSFKKSFIKSCSGSNAVEEKVDFCTCLAGHLVDYLSVKELRDEEFLEEYMKENALKFCPLEQQE